MRIDKPEEAHRCFQEAFNAADMDALLSLYEPEAKLVPQPGQVVAGRAAIRSALQQFLALKGRMSLQTEYVIQTGELALCRGRWVLRGTGPDGSPLELSGNTSEVLRRQSDGRWLLAIDHPNGSD